MDSDDEDSLCPLCMEELDITDKNFEPCPCGYQMCRFCWHRVKENMNGLCPNCRRPYDPQNYSFVPPDPAELERMKKEKKQKERERKSQNQGQNRHLSNVRVIQRNLVYVTNLPLAHAREDVLRRHEYFGQYGKVLKVVINKNHIYNSDSPQGPSVSAYVTFSKRDDAARAILGVNGVAIEGRQLRASYGTTKYCTYFLKGLPCTNPDCMYLHELGVEKDSFTKEEMTAGGKQMLYPEGHAPRDSGKMQQDYDMPQQNSPPPSSHIPIPLAKKNIAESGEWKEEKPAWSSPSILSNSGAYLDPEQWPDALSSSPPPPANNKPERSTPAPVTTGPSSALPPSVSWASSLKTKTVETPSPTTTPPLSTTPPVSSSPPAKTVNWPKAKTKQERRAERAEAAAAAAAAAATSQAQAAAVKQVSKPVAVTPASVPPPTKFQQEAVQDDWEEGIEEEEPAPQEEAPAWDKKAKNAPTTKNEAAPVNPAVQTPQAHRPQPSLASNLAFQSQKVAEEPPAIFGVKSPTKSAIEPVQTANLWNGGLNFWSAPAKAEVDEADADFEWSDAAVGGIMDLLDTKEAKQETFQKPAAPWKFNESPKAGQSRFGFAQEEDAANNNLFGGFSGPSMSASAARLSTSPPTGFPAQNAPPENFFKTLFPHVNVSFANQQAPQPQPQPPQAAAPPVSPTYHANQVAPMHPFGAQTPQIYPGDYPMGRKPSGGIWDSNFTTNIFGDSSPWAQAPARSFEAPQSNGWSQFSSVSHGGPPGLVPNRVSENLGWNQSAHPMQNYMQPTAQKSQYNEPPPNPRASSGGFVDPAILGAGSVRAVDHTSTSSWNTTPSAYRPVSLPFQTASAPLNETASFGSAPGFSGQAMPSVAPPPGFKRENSAKDMRSLKEMQDPASDPTISQGKRATTATSETEEDSEEQSEELMDDDALRKKERAQKKKEKKRERNEKKRREAEQKALDELLAREAKNRDEESKKAKKKQQQQQSEAPKAAPVITETKQKSPQSEQKQVQAKTPQKPPVQPRPATITPPATQPRPNVQNSPSVSAVQANNFQVNSLHATTIQANHIQVNHISVNSRGSSPGSATVASSSIISNIEADLNTLLNLEAMAMSNTGILFGPSFPPTPEIEALEKEVANARKEVKELEDKLQELKLRNQEFDTKAFSSAS
eukprot:TRINITY_DN3302_c0_g1_i2.p1 TRINITY_DN3302_c0_g1~~TRINITY_DN3302_c0_g1_i2.p1  ORF type:complete len:1166 (-),score=378.20 TRINITY_DN3302_c0_g1_i2:30-3527(-)